MKKEISNLINKIDIASSNNKKTYSVNREIMKSFLSEIKKIGYKDFVINLVDNTSKSFYMEVLICTSDFFLNLSKKDIIGILDLLSVKITKVGWIEYLCRYLELNGLEIIYTSNLTTKEKKELFSFFYKNPFLLFKDENDYQVLQDDNIGISIPYLREIKQKMMANTNLKEMIPKDDLQSYIISLNPIS